MRNVIESINKARRGRDALASQRCELRSGFSMDTLMALRAAGMTRTELCKGGSEMTAERAIALAAVDREIQRIDAEIDELEASLQRLGREINPSVRGQAAEAADGLPSSAMVIAFPAHAARQSALKSVDGTASVA